jgi:SAM-dependent methyltransferase
MVNEWLSAEHAQSYLARADHIPHRTEGDAVLIEILPASAARILDLGTGNGRLIALLKAARPDLRAVALDFSPTMLQAVSERFRGDEHVQIVQHDLDNPLPQLGKFDAIVSGLAIHHCVDARKRGIYAETFDRLEPGGMFCNLDHVASPTPRLHAQFFAALGRPEDPSNKLADLDVQLRWLREIGFQDVDCLWKWRELALLVGTRP